MKLLQSRFNFHTAVMENKGSSSDFLLCKQVDIDVPLVK